MPVHLLTVGITGAVVAAITTIGLPAQVSASAWRGQYDKFAWGWQYSRARHGIQEDNAWWLNGYGSSRLSGLLGIMDRRYSRVPSYSYSPTRSYGYSRTPSYSYRSYGYGRANRWPSDPPGNGKKCGPPFEPPGPPPCKPPPHCSPFKPKKWHCSIGRPWWRVIHSVLFRIFSRW